MKLFISSLLFFTAFSSCLHAKGNCYDYRSIFYPNDFQFIENSLNPLAVKAKSVAALIPEKNIHSETSEGFIRVKKQILGEKYHLCEDELFFNEFTASSCSGFLVAPQILLTAGHCIPSRCEDEPGSYWIFDFNRVFIEESIQSDEYFEIPKNNIYKCNKVLEHYYATSAFIDIEQNDYAVVLLDRPVFDRPLLKLRNEGKINNDENIVTIGHPSGLPAIVSDNAKVRQNHYKHYFSADLDAVRGNSGGPVFNEKTQEVEGIIVRAGSGMPGYGYDRTQNPPCKRMKIDKFYYSGTEVVRITSVKNLFKWIDHKF